MKTYSSILGRVGTILAKLIEIAFWIGTVGLLVAWIMALFFPAQIADGTLVSVSGTTEPLSFMGLDAGAVSLKTLGRALCFLCPAGAILCVLYAMIFRNIYAILKFLHAEKGLAFSSENSPFRLEIAHRVQKIGLFAIAIPLFSLLGQAVLYAVGLSTAMDLNMSQLAMGLAVLYLASVFQYGVKLQSEIDEVV